MTLEEITAVMNESDLIRIMKDNNEIYAGYLGCLVYEETYGKIKALVVEKLSVTLDVTHRKYKELGLMRPLHPEQTQDYKFSDLQTTLYRTIILKSED